MCRCCLPAAQALEALLEVAHQPSSSEQAMAMSPHSLTLLVSCLSHHQKGNPQTAAPFIEENRASEKKSANLADSSLSASSLSCLVQYAHHSMIPSDHRPSRTIECLGNRNSTAYQIERLMTLSQAALCQFPSY